MSDASVKDGGPAFPNDGPDFRSNFTGMSLRDWFAGQAVTGLLSTGDFATWGEVAEDAYAFADAMLAERAKAVQP